MPILLIKADRDKTVKIYYQKFVPEYPLEIKTVNLYNQYGQKTTEFKRGDTVDPRITVENLTGEVVTGIAIFQAKDPTGRVKLLSDITVSFNPYETKEVNMPDYNIKSDDPTGYWEGEFYIWKSWEQPVPLCRVVELLFHVT